MLEASVGICIAGLRQVEGPLLGTTQCSNGHTALYCELACRWAMSGCVCGSGTHDAVPLPSKPTVHHIRSNHASPHLPDSTLSPSACCLSSPLCTISGANTPCLTCHVGSCHQVHLSLQAQVVAHRPRLSGVLPEGEEAVKLHPRWRKCGDGSSSGDLQIGSKGSECEGERAPREGQGWVRQLVPAHKGYVYNEDDAC